MPDVVATFGIDDAGVEAGIDRAERTLSRFEKRANAVAKDLGKVTGAALGGVGIAAAAGTLMKFASAHDAFIAKQREAAGTTEYFSDKYEELNDAIGRNMDLLMQAVGSRGSMTFAETAGSWYNSSVNFFGQFFQGVGGGDMNKESMGDIDWLNSRKRRDDAAARAAQRAMKIEREAYLAQLEVGGGTPEENIRRRAEAQAARATQERDEALAALGDAPEAYAGPARERLKELYSTRLFAIGQERDEKLLKLQQDAAKPAQAEAEERQRRAEQEYEAVHKSRIETLAKLDLEKQSARINALKLAGMDRAAALEQETLNFLKAEQEINESLGLTQDEKSAAWDRALATMEANKALIEAQPENGTPGGPGRAISVQTGLLGGAALAAQSLSLATAAEAEERRRQTQTQTDIKTILERLEQALSRPIG